MPAYIYVPRVEYKTDKATEGDSTHKILDVWISKDGIAIAEVGIPALIPVQYFDSTNITFDAGVLKTGADEERIPYPLFKPVVKKLNLRPAVIDTVVPVFSYYPFRKIALFEDYDLIGSNFYINPAYKQTGDTVLRVNDNRALIPGRNSGKIVMSPTTSTFQLLTTDQFTTLPIGNTPVFLEIDFKTNLTLDVGYYYAEPGSSYEQIAPIVQLFPTEKWNKIYIALNVEVASRPAGTAFRFYIGTYNANPSQQAEIFLDNIKIVYLE